MTTFSDFGLAPSLLSAVTAEGYTVPTPIQAQAIPHVMAGRDVCGIAQTGTGKTAAFALPILHRLQADPRRPLPASCRVLVLSPTRELASQIADGFRGYGANLKLRVSVIFGGVSDGKQKAELRPGVDVLVATPGRLLDLIDQRALNLGQTEILVLDEADQMLDLGFIHDLRKIAAMVPKKRQTLFFSATMPKAIADLAGGYLTDPVQVSVAPAATTVEKVAQSVMHVPVAAKPALLEAVLRDAARRDGAIERVLVFSRTKHGADKIARKLNQAGIEASAIHGNKSQPQRERALKDFRDGACKVLIATDIAARGIDVDGVSRVINYDLPNVPESYVHRIGRTARAGASGLALSFCSADERSYLRDIERTIGMKVPTADLPEGFDAGPREQAEDRAEPRRDARPPRRDVSAAAPATASGDSDAEPRRRRRRRGGKGRKPAADGAVRQQDAKASAGTGDPKANPGRPRATAPSAGKRPVSYGEKADRGDRRPPAGGARPDLPAFLLRGL